MSYHYSSTINGDNLFGNIASTDLRDLAKSYGWLFLPEAIKDKLYVADNRRYPRRQLNFPIDMDAPDYSEAIAIAIQKISELESKPVEAIISEILEIKDDTLRFRIIDTRNENVSIPLSYAVSAINGAKELFVSAASTVLKPQAHHPKMNRTEALELVDKSKFRHTERGSFALKVSSPIRAIDIHANFLEGESIPFVRQTTLTINIALSQLTTAIQTDTLDDLVDQIKQSDSPYVSSNLCKAIVNFKEEHDDFSLSIDFKWAGILAIPNGMVLASEIKIPSDYFGRIDDVRRELRNTETHKEGVFIGTVERLDGTVDREGKRSGEVILNLLEEDEIIRARVNLNQNQYSLADKAHMTPGTFIRLKAKLHPGNQPRLLSESVFVRVIRSVDKVFSITSN